MIPRDWTREACFWEKGGKKSGAAISKYCPIIDEKEGEGAVTGRLGMRLVSGENYRRFQM
jgi:hypothetical protein